MRSYLRNSLLHIFSALCLAVVSATSLNAQLVVESVSIEHGAVNVPEVTDVSVTFSEPIAPFLVPGVLDVLTTIDLELVDPECPFPPAGIFITPGGCADSVSLSEDGRTVTLHSVQLESDRDHTLIVLYAVGQSGAALEVPTVVRFSTGPTLPQGGITGSVSTTGPTAQGTLLLAVRAPFPLDAEEPTVESNIGFADQDGNYDLSFVPDGTYHVIGIQFDVTDPEAAFESLFIGTVDGNGDMIADVIEVSGGTVVNGIDVSTSNQGATASTLNTPAIDLLHQEAPGAMLGMAVGAGMNLDGTALTWAYVYTSIATGRVWAAAGLGSFVFPPQLLDLGEDGELLIAILGAYPVPPDFGDSDDAVDGFLNAGGATFLSEYEGAVGVSAVMNAELFAFIEVLLEGDVSGFLSPIKDVMDQLGQIPNLEHVLSKQTGEVWVVSYIAPLGPGLYLVAMDDAGNPLLIAGSATARENGAAAAAEAAGWAADAALVSVSTEFLPIDPMGNSITWTFNYYSASKDSVLSVIASGGAAGGVLTSSALDPSAVPSTEPLPEDWIDSPAALLAGSARGSAFVENHPDALATATLSRGLQISAPDRAIWRFGYQGTAIGSGETEFLDVDIDAQSGTYVAIDDDRVVPAAFALGQNYPNPFNPSTVIPYQVGERGPVTLEVFDALGRRVATLVDGVQPAGSYEVQWDASQTLGSGQPSGVYVYRLRTEGSVLSRTMLLVK